MSSSESAQCWTQYVFYVYAVTLAADAPALRSDVNEWASADDTRPGQPATGRAISATVSRVLVHAQAP